MRAMNTRATDRVSDPQLDSLRVPPHSIEAEQSVLGGLLLDNAAWDRIADFVNEDDFYRYDHRIIFQHIVKLINATKPADVITVFEALSISGKADEVGVFTDVFRGAAASSLTGRSRGRSSTARSRARGAHAAR